jgi:hypothetical protein
MTGAIILTSCEHPIDAPSEITIDDLLANQAFQTFAEKNDVLSIPILQNVNSMQHEEVLELSKKLDKKISSLQKNDIRSKSQTPEFEEIVQLMGNENAIAYKALVTDAKNAFEKFTEVYPEFEELADEEKKALFKEATLAYYKGNTSYSSKESKASGNLITSIGCDDVEGFNECISDVGRNFKFVTAGCVASGYFGFVPGLACHALNILHHQSQKRECARDYCPPNDEQ